jgi:hypothetical protein
LRHRDSVSDLSPDSRNPENRDRPLAPLHIDVKNPERVPRGGETVTLNGEPLPDNLVPADRVAAGDRVDVVMGPAASGLFKARPRSGWWAKINHTVVENQPSND